MFIYIHSCELSSTTNIYIQWYYFLKIAKAVIYKLLKFDACQAKCFDVVSKLNDSARGIYNIQYMMEALEAAMIRGRMYGTSHPLAPSARPFINTS